MKKFRLLLALATVLFCLQGGIAQIHVDANEDVSVGSVSTNNAKLNVNNTTNTYGLRVYQNYNISSGYSYGIYNYVPNTGTSFKYGMFNDVRQNSSSTNNARGIQTEIRHYGTGVAYGILNYIRNYGTGRKYGRYSYFYQNASSTNALYGNLEYQRNYGSGISYGTYTTMYAYGTGAKVGEYMNVQQPAGVSQYLIGNNLYLRHKGFGYTYGYQVYIDDDGTGNKTGDYSRVYQLTGGAGSVKGMYNETHLNGSGTGYGIHNMVYDNASSSSTKYGIYNYLENDGSGARYALWSGVKGQGDWAGYFSGNVYVSGTVTEAGSDARLKEEIKDLSGSLDILDQLAPKTYLFKKDMGLNLPGGQQYGLVAQDLEKVLPALVSDVKHPGLPIIEKKMVKETVMVDPETDLKETDVENGELVEDELPTPTEKVVEVEKEVVVGYGETQTFKAVNYKGLIPILVGAIKEQQTIVENQQTQIENQETRAQQQQTEIEQLRQELKALSKQLQGIKE